MLERIQPAGAFAPEVPQSPEHARPSEVEALEAGPRFVTFVVQRMQGPAPVDSSVPRDVTDD
jgi:hypothetical protein